jgi:hypothetical protein
MADERPRRRRRGRSLPTLVVLPLVLMSVWIDQGVIKVHWLIATAVVAAVVLLEEFPPPDPGPVLRVLQEALRRYGSAALAAVTGAAVVFSGWTMAGWSQTRLSACEPPVELRVMAAAETLRTMRAKADEFAAEQAEGARCRPVHVTVFGAPALRPLTDAFITGWLDDNADLSPLATVGPRPDLWLASSRAIADYMTVSDAKGAHARTTSAGAVSPLVLAISRNARRLVDGPLESWEDVVGRVRDNGVTLLRPSPESSDVAVIATTALYGPSHNGEERHRREQQVSPPGVPLADVDQMLCGVRRRLIEDPGYKVALMVPEHSLADYARGAPLGGACTHRLNHQETLAQSLDVVRPRRTPLFDYSIVQITWDDEQDPERERLAGLFRDWLAGQGPRLGKGFERPGGPSTVEPVDVARLETAYNEIDAARRPRTLLFALDRSGSMKAPVSGGTAIGRARDLIDEAAGWLGAGDQAGLWVFPGQDGREPSVLAGLTSGEEAARSLRSAIGGDDVAATGGTTPLYHVIAEGSKALRKGSHDRSLVVLTDGDDDTGRRTDEDLAALRRELRSTEGPRVYLVVVGERGCDGPLSDLMKESPRSLCLDFGSSDDPRQVVGRLFTEIWKD